MSRSFCVRGEGVSMVSAPSRKREIKRKPSPGCSGTPLVQSKERNKDNVLKKREREK